PLPAGERAARARQSVRRGLQLPVAALLLVAALAAGRRLREAGGGRARAALAALPLATRAALAALGVPVPDPDSPALSPEAFSADRLRLLGWDLPLGPASALFATPADLLLTAAALLASLAGWGSWDGKPAAPHPTGRRRAAFRLVLGALAVRLGVEALATIAHGVAVDSPLDLLPAETVLPDSAAAVLLGAAALAGLAGLLVLEAAASALLPAGRLLAGRWGLAAAAGAALAAALVPAAGAPLTARLAAPAVGALSAWVAAVSASRRGTGLTAAAARMLLAAALVHGLVEAAAARVRDEEARARVSGGSAPAELARTLRDTLASVAQDPEAAVALGEVRRRRDPIPADLGVEAFRALTRQPAEEALVRLWARHVRPARLTAAVLCADDPYFSYDPIAAFGPGAPAPLRRQFDPISPSSRWDAVRAGPEAGLDLPWDFAAPKSAYFRALGLRASVPGERGTLGDLLLVAPDPSDLLAAMAPPPLPAGASPGTVRRPLLLVYGPQGLVVASDPRIRPGRALPAELGTAGDRPRRIRDRFEDTPYDLWARRRADQVELAGYPAPEPGPVSLRFARFLLVALAVGGLAFLAGLAARLAMGLPFPGEWRRRFAYRLVSSYLLLTVPPFVAVALLSQELISVRILSGIAGLDVALQVERDALEAEVREFYDPKNPQGPKGLKAEKLRDPDWFGDAWCLKRSRVVGRELALYALDEAGGMTLAGTARRDLALAGFADRRLPGEVAEALLVGNREDHVLQEVVAGERVLAVYRPLLSLSGQRVGVLALTWSGRERRFRSEVGETLAVIYAISLFVVLAAAGTGLAVARRISRPVEELTDAMRTVAGGDLTVRLPVASRDEIGDLVASFNRMAEELREGRDRLAQAEREAAWRLMAQQIAHEIKNPLTPLKLSAQHLERAYRDKAENFAEVLAEATARIAEQVEALRGIASRFSVFAGRGEREIRPVDLSEIAKEAAGLFAGTGGDVEIRTRIHSGLPPVLADRDELRRVVINLLQNAIQALGGKGEVVIRTLAAARPRVEASGATRRIAGATPTPVASWVGLEVRDNGSGIPPDVQARLFEPYFSTKTEGTGLGLYICRRAVEDLGGEIAIASEPGKGTSAWVWLPAAPEAPGDPAVPSARVPDSPETR
ncbi:MAG: ATP-binding protein, partial [Planctomycetales bacterium]|nr:ATP-binding protein [Planctomycetales bacterium]